MSHGTDDEGYGGGRREGPSPMGPPGCRTRRLCSMLLCYAQTLIHSLTLSKPASACPRNQRPVIHAASQSRATSSMRAGQDGRAKRPPRQAPYPLTRCPRTLTLRHTTPRTGDPGFVAPTQLHMHELHQTGNALRTVHGMPTASRVHSHYVGPGRFLWDSVRILDAGG
ncbi:hypothetical protein AURDEDRAFT_182221 [Auricularia subglabra TFB-10046 SS5]|nr:hypothetical protein AURDEDRAFT_182221 [Auricularia subglabra TFB-10046 SS5]